MNLVFYGGGDAEDNFHLDEQLLNIPSRKTNLQMTFIPSSSYQSEFEFEDFVDQYSKFKVKRFLKLSLDEHFSLSMQEAVLRSDIIFLGGGNTYYFLFWLKKTKFLNKLIEWVKAGGVLSGLSAGAIIMTRNIHLAGIPDFDRDINEDNMKNFKAMNLCRFEFFPHYRNSKRYDEALVDYSKNKKHPIYASKDGSGIILSTNELRFVGQNYCFFDGKKVTLIK